MIALPPARDWLYSVKVFCASMLALYIALYMELPRPYWAMASVYIVSSPFVGPTSSKALYRALGTLLGAAAAIFFVPLLVQAPTLLALVVAIWTGTMLFLSMHVRTANSYTVMLAGYTMVMIAYPTVDNPQSVFDVGVSRSEEILLAIVCASVVGSVFFPSRLAPVLADNTRRWFNDARAYCARVLGRDPEAKALAGLRASMIGTFNGLEMMIGQLPHEGAHPRTVRNAEELRQRMALLLPVIDVLSDALLALQQRAPSRSERLAPLLDRCTAWVDSDAPAAERQQLWAELHEALAQLEPPVETLLDARQTLLANALYRLRQWLDLWQDCRSLQQALLDDDHGPWRSVYRHWHLGSGARFFDRGLMIYSTAYIILGIFIAAQLWIWLGWQDGSGAVILAAVACSFFASLDEPATQIFRFFTWTCVSIVLASLYLFVVLPNVHDFPMLVLAFAGPFICVGTLTVQPRFYLPMLLTAVNTATFVSIQGAYEANFLTFLNGNLSGPVGLLFAFVWTLIFRPFGAGLAARRMTRSSWEDLVELSQASTLAAQRRMAGRMLDRFMQHVPRLNASGQDPTGAVHELRIAYNLLDLAAQLPRLSPEARRTVSAVLKGVGRHFRRCLRADQRKAPSEALLGVIEHGRRAAARDATEVDHHDAAMVVLHALGGLAMALLPGIAVGAIAPDEEQIPHGLDGAPL
jgi:uncharacterized membrane protein YccC